MGLMTKLIDKRIAAYQSELIQTHYAEVQNMYNQMRGWRHDYRNQNELVNLHYDHSDEELNLAIEEFAYMTYNHIRPHSYNRYKTPFEVRYGAGK